MPTKRNPHRKISKNLFDEYAYSFGTYVPDYSIFTRNQCHIDECWRSIYLDNLCKRHYDLNWYRQQTEALHP